MVKYVYLDRLLEQYGHLVYAKYNAPSDAIYIGRGSKFGNPFPMKSESDRENVCHSYYNYLINKLASDEKFRKEVMILANKKLMCFCSNGTTSKSKGARYCHGHALAAAAHQLNVNPKAYVAANSLNNEYDLKILGLNKSKIEKIIAKNNTSLVLKEITYIEYLKLLNLKAKKS